MTLGFVEPADTLVCFERTAFGEDMVCVGAQSASSSSPGDCRAIRPCSWLAESCMKGNDAGGEQGAICVVICLTAVGL